MAASASSIRRLLLPVPRALPLPGLAAVLGSRAPPLFSSCSERSSPSATTLGSLHLCCTLNTTAPLSGSSPAAQSPAALPEAEAILPLPERCKGLLVANWRAQLTSISASPSSHENGPHLRSSLVPFSLHNGSPVVWVAPDDLHASNVVLDERVSVLVGGTDPVGLVQAMRARGRSHQRAVFMGDLTAPAPSEVAHLRKLLSSKSARAMKAATSAGLTAGQSEGSAEDTPSLLLALSSPSPQALPSSAPAVGADWLPFRLACRQCQFIDVSGVRTAVPVDSISAAAADPLALVSVPLLDAINRTMPLRQSLVLFLAAYMGVDAQAEGAYMVSLDRWGFNVLASCMMTDNSKDGPEWKEFRFSFQSEAPTVATFLRAIRNMEEETWDHQVK